MATHDLQPSPEDGNVSSRRSFLKSGLALGAGSIVIKQAAVTAEAAGEPYILVKDVVRIETAFERMSLLEMQDTLEVMRRMQADPLIQTQEDMDRTLQAIRAERCNA